MNTTVADTAQTFGWDTVFATRISDVNAAIAAAKSSPVGWRQADVADGYVVSGTFGAWSIVPGGSGDIVRLSLPMPEIDIAGPSGTERGTGTARADIRLDLLHDADVEHRRHLKVRTTPVADGVAIANVDDIAFYDPQPSFIAKAATRQLLQDWLNAHLGDFDHVFSTIDLNRLAASGAFQWMQPTDVAYAYCDLGSDGALAILCMTGGRSSAGLIQQVSSQCVPSGAKSGLLISCPRVMSELLLPSMPLVFKSASPSDFSLSATENSIVNATGEIAFAVTSKGKEYKAQIESLSVTIRGSEMTFDVTTKTDLSPGIYAYCRSVSALNLTLGSAPGGGQCLLFKNASDPVVRHWTDSDPSIKLTEEILAIEALVLSLVATVLTDGAAIGALALAIGFAAGVMALSDTAIEMAGRDGAPAIGSAVLDATAAITWPGASHFTLTDASFSDSMLLTGARSGASI